MWIFLLAAVEVKRQEGRKPLRGQDSGTPKVRRLDEETQHCEEALWGARSGPTEVDNVFKECRGGAHW